MNKVEAYPEEALPHRGKRRQLLLIFYLQVALDNFARIDEDSEEFGVQLPLGGIQRDELTEALVYRQLEGMDLDQLERYFLETQIECYHSHYTETELLTEMKEYYDEDEFSEIMAELAQ